MFERLVLWLVKRGYKTASSAHNDGSGDKGLDIVSNRQTTGGLELRYIQFKRYKTIGFSTLCDEFDKIDHLY